MSNSVDKISNGFVEATETIDHALKNIKLIKETICNMEALLSDPISHDNAQMIQDAYDSYRNQINTIAENAEYKGTNLISESGENYPVNYNHDTSERLDIESVNLASSGLNITESMDFTAQENVTTVLAELLAAKSAIDGQVAKFEVKKSIIDIMSKRHQKAVDLIAESKDDEQIKKQFIGPVYGKYVLENSINNLDSMKDVILKMRQLIVDAKKAEYIPTEINTYYEQYREHIDKITNLGGFEGFNMIGVRSEKNLTVKLNAQSDSIFDLETIDLTSAGLNIAGASDLSTVQSLDEAKGQLDSALEAIEVNRAGFAENIDLLKKVAIYSENAVDVLNNAKSYNGVNFFGNEIKHSLYAIDYANVQLDSIHDMLVEMQSVLNYARASENSEESQNEYRRYMEVINYIARSDFYGTKLIDAGANPLNIPMSNDSSYEIASVDCTTSGLAIREDTDFGHAESITTANNELEAAITVIKNIKKSFEVHKNFLNNMQKTQEYSLIEPSKVKQGMVMPSSLCYKSNEASVNQASSLNNKNREHSLLNNNVTLALK